MSHILGVYFAPEHHRQSDRDFIQKLQPPVIRLLDPDVQQIADMHALCPDAIIAPRTWAIDDSDGNVVRNLMADPIKTGHDLAEKYRGQLNRWQQEAQQRGLKLPPPDRLMFSFANEPNQGGTPDKIAVSNVAFFERCTQLAIRSCGPCLGVGWPGNTGPDTPVNWKDYADAGLVEAIRRGNHWLDLHEYHYKTGPQDGWRWLAGRHLQCPFDVPILLGEIGIDNYVDKERWDREGGNRGWKGNVSPDAYADMIERHIRGCDTRVVAALPFITDFRSNAWESFDTSDAHGALLARKDTMVPQVGFATKPTPPPDPGAPQPVPSPVPALAHPIQDPAKRIVSQVFGVNPERYARFGLDGHNGIDFAVPVGTHIHAVDGGRVVEARNDADGYGEYIKVVHDWGESLYAHLSHRFAGVGEYVLAGEPIALSGNTGNSTGPHLHFGMRINPYKRGKPYDGYSDPAPYIVNVTPQPQPDGSILQLIKAAAAEFSLDWQLLASMVYAESKFDRTAVSPAGAMGLTQIMPLTWAEWSAKVGANDPFNAKDNLRVGAAYLRWCLSQVDGNRAKALVAYNFGIGNVLQGVEAPLETRIYAYGVVHGADLLKAVDT